MGIFLNTDKTNLHHAYLIEGDRALIFEEVLKFVQSLGIDTKGNSDFTHIHLDTFRVEDARELKSLTTLKGYEGTTKVFLLSSNNFLLEAQNTMLKMLEEPIKNTVFFIIVPDANALLSTFVSRFYFIPRVRQDLAQRTASSFMSMAIDKRINFIKEFLAEPEEEDLVSDSTRTKALKFINDLEASLHMSRIVLDTRYFEQIMKARKFLRMPGSSAKMLLESVALTVPQNLLK